MRALLASTGKFPTYELQWEDKLPFDTRKKARAVVAATKTS